ncbi:MAG TPA: adenylate cyclase [Spongiibacteraceae bacterium]|nr:adenylate cyclase [Spongiibacteraceae bacterium]HCS25901.1 adenylate cyclase [Spongiibacteraceae bacterium]
MLALFLFLAATPLLADMPEGDARRGQLAFGPCRTCHYPEKVVGHNNGPSLWNIFNKKVGSQAGFDYYSDALKNADFVWTPALMDIWLADPQKFLPGNMMMSLGIPDAQDRADVIEYLKTFSE